MSLEVGGGGVVPRKVWVKTGVISTDSSIVAVWVGGECGAGAMFIVLARGTQKCPVMDKDDACVPVRELS